MIEEKVVEALYVEINGGELTPITEVYKPEAWGTVLRSRLRSLLAGPDGPQVAEELGLVESSGWLCLECGGHDPLYPDKTLYRLPDPDA